jgi:hypothetical protein
MGLWDALVDALCSEEALAVLQTQQLLEWTSPARELTRLKGDGFITNAELREIIAHAEPRQAAKALVVRGELRRENFRRTWLT